MFLTSRLRGASIGEGQMLNGSNRRRLFSLVGYKLHHIWRIKLGSDDGQQAETCNFMHLMLQEFTIERTMALVSKYGCYLEQY